MVNGGNPDANRHQWSIGSAFERFEAHRALGPGQRTEAKSIVVSVFLSCRNWLLEFVVGIGCRNRLFVSPWVIDRCYRTNRSAFPCFVSPDAFLLSLSLQATQRRRATARTGGGGGGGQRHFPLPRAGAVSILVQQSQCCRRLLVGGRWGVVVVALGRPEEPRVPQDLKKNDMVYLIALLDHVLWTKKNMVYFGGLKDHILWTKESVVYFLGLKDHVR